MRFSFLGTSHGVPAADRFTSCYLLEVGDNLYVFDAGAPVTNLLLQRGADMKQVKAFFCSHFHGDHIDGGVTMLNLFDWYYKDTSIDAFLPDEVTERVLRIYGRDCEDAYFTDGRVRFHVIQPGVIFEDGVIRVTAIPVQHINHPEKRSYGFAIEAEGKHILYTGDLSHEPDEKDFPEIAYRQHFDLILTECAHFTVDRLKNCMDRVDADYFAVSHIFPLEKIPQIEELAPRYAFKLLIPNDGDEIIL